MADTIATIEAALLADPAVDTDFSGSTLVAAAVRGNSITIANVGDSRITLGIRDAASGAVRTEALSFDHKPDLPAEKARILAAGGRVFAVEYDDGVDGPPRVWLGHMDVPGLAMSRSLGDKVSWSVRRNSEERAGEQSGEASWWATGSGGHGRGKLTNLVCFPRVGRAGSGDGLKALRVMTKVSTSAQNSLCTAAFLRYRAGGAHGGREQRGGVHVAGVAAGRAASGGRHGRYGGRHYPAAGHRRPLGVYEQRRVHGPCSGRR
ncbi:unnamed protein product [Phaeothamnion confervicola]